MSKDTKKATELITLIEKGIPVELAKIMEVKDEKAWYSVAN